MSPKSAENVSPAANSAVRNLSGKLRRPQTVLWSKTFSALNMPSFETYLNLTLPAFYQIAKVLFDWYSTGMQFADVRTYFNTRTEHLSRNDVGFIAGMGLAVALLLLPLLQNLGASALLTTLGISVPLVVVALMIAMPIGMLCGSVFLTLLPFRHHHAIQLSRYVVIGAFNVALNASIFNSLILVSGISQGLWVTLFAFITFLIVVTQAFFWNVFWTFRDAPPQNRVQQYQRFVAVSGAVAAVNISIIHILVNVVGAPAGIPGPVWANIALLCTIFTAVLGNFIGYKLFVFRH